jgi:hypothetical protein
LAEDGGDEISEKQAVRSAIATIEGTGEFSDACRDWRKIPEDEQTLAKFTTHFKKAVTERQRQATSASTGFQSGNLSQHVQPAANAADSTTQGVPCSTARHYYCWSHRLSTNPAHTSALCNNPKPEHVNDATLANM